MNPAFAARLPFEMFHRIRDIDLCAIDSGFFERLIHDFSSRSNERLTGDIFVISRLLSDEHHRCTLRAFAKDRLRGALVKMARLAIFRRLAQRRPARRRSEEHTSEL